MINWWNWFASLVLPCWGGGGGGGGDFGCAMAFTKRYRLTWPKVFDMFHS
jgi:hypothetical protein